MFVLTGGFRGDCENQVTVILEKIESWVFTYMICMELFQAGCRNRGKSCSYSGW